MSAGPGHPQVLIVMHHTSQHLMRRACAKLAAAGCATQVVPATEFNNDPRENDEILLLLVTNAADCSAERLQRFQSLRGVVFMGSGTDTIDIKHATERGLQVGHGPTPENAESMSEATVLLILACLYRLHEAERLISEGLPRPTEPYGRMLKNKTLGLIGFGRIARGVAERLTGWQVEILAYSPRLSAGTLPQGVQAASLEDLLQKSDVVSIHAAMNDQARNLLDRGRLSLMKPGAVLINTARGGLVDETALYEAVSGGRLSAIALDTFAQEPPATENPLFRLRQGIFTPHIIGHTVEALDSVVNAAVENSLAILRGERAKYLKNPDVLSRTGS